MISKIKERLLDYINFDGNSRSIRFDAPAGFTGQGAIWYLSTPPEGWLICDGSLVDKDKYPKLWLLLQDEYGTSTATQFYLPDMKGRVPVGLASSGTFSTFKATGGAETVALSHNHDLSTGYGYMDLDASRTYIRRSGVPSWPSANNETTTWGGGSGTRSSGMDLGGVSGNSLSNSTNILQPYRVVNLIIKT